MKYPGWHREVTGKLKRFEKAAFGYDADRDEYICPEGRRLVRTGDDGWNGDRAMSPRRSSTRVRIAGLSVEVELHTGGRQPTLKRLPKLSHQSRVRQRLTSEEGVKLRQRRGWETETRFAMMKRNLGFTRFRLRGFGKATVELGYLVIAMNLMRLASPAAQPI